MLGVARRLNKLAKGHCRFLRRDQFLAGSEQLPRQNQGTNPRAPVAGAAFAGPPV